MSRDDPPAGPVRSVLLRLVTLGQADPQVSVGDVVEFFGEASFVPALMVPALVIVSPLSGIFFLPTILGLTIALIALQMLVGRRRLWLPGVLERRSVKGERLAAAAARLMGPAAWLDRQTRAGRLGLFSRLPLRLLPPVGCVVSGLMMPFLELVPLSSSILGGAVTLFCVAILTRDGLFTLLGLVSIGIASLIPLFVIYRFG